MFSNHYLQEKIILPLSDILTGQCVNKSLKFLMKSQYWTREEIDNFQNKKLRELIRHSYNNVPYYHDLFVKLSLKPEDIKTKEDLIKLPILTKAIIKKEGIARFTAKNISKRHIIYSASSGSTGEPLRFLITKESYSMNIAANLRGWYGTGYRLGDKYIKLSQNLRKNPIKRLQDAFTHNLYLATNPLIGENYKFILDQIEKYQPTVIRCYPDPLLFIAQYKLEHSSEYTFRPKVITTTGNMLFPEVRKVIEDAFECKIFDSYSCEGNSCVFECPTHQCYHSTEEYGISEILDTNGNLIQKGIGRLLSTDLWNYAHPFIRFDTQDVVEVDNTFCECGRNHLRINKILGRDNEVLIVPSGRRFIVHNFTGFFQTDIPEIDKSIEQFQIIMKKNGSVLFRLVVNSHYSKRAQNYIIQYWQKKMEVPVVVELVSEIPIMQNNKRRFIVNE